ncbi:hypothetical protein P22_0474 [Propionispora sp. 2/2-37]|uniref:polysaccharide deacetylase family protein n=1 Tax=Propionispora sp. 2/2-37 TaxID=1677858 RepID=UPI0006BB95C2|nr:polysaccharide deacetylase family protein [Propionispora sp. 2/2-37]CUH94408.1 hypothetical protein P22_0474 [Propionispora sp. 2/2-37]
MRSGLIGLFFCLSLLVTGGYAAAGYQNGIPVLLYHHISDGPDNLPELGVSVDEFDRQMRALKEAGFQSIPLAVLYAYMRGEQVDLPDSPVVITFDDGYEDNYSAAHPILEHYGFQAVLFMVGENFDRNDRLSAGQAREMVAQTWEMESHTRTHPDLTGLDRKALKQELYDGKRKVEKTVRKEVRFFAYPGGFYNLPVFEAVQAAGYQGAFSVLTGLNRPDRDNVYLLRRIPVFRSTNFDKILELLTRNHPKTSVLDYDP